MCIRDRQSIGPNATSVQHDTSLPYRPTTNSEIEAVNRFVLEGARCILIQAGLPSPFWPYAVRYFCLARNVLKPYGDDGSTPWWNRFEEVFQVLWSNSTKRQPGTLITFGSLVKFLPSKTKTSEKQKMQPKAVEGVQTRCWRQMRKRRTCCTTYRVRINEHADRKAHSHQ